MNITNPSPPPSPGQLSIRPGAPQGNTNALKHGFYSRKFRSADLQDLETYEFSGLDDEIIMLRVFIRRVVEMTGDIEDLDQAVSLLRALSLAVISLTRLLRTQTLLPHGESIADALAQAIAEIDLKQQASHQPPIPSPGLPLPAPSEVSDEE
jgi:hypothetical protein